MHYNSCLRLVAQGLNWMLVSRDVRDGCSDWMVHINMVSHFLYEKGIQMNVWIMDFPLLRSFQQQFSLSLFWAALFLWGVYRGYNNKKENIWFVFL